MKRLIFLLILVSALIANPEADKYYRMGIREFKNRNYRKAHSYLSRSIKLDSTKPVRLYSFALISYLTGNLKTAAKYCNKILKMPNVKPAVMDRTRYLLKKIRHKASLTRKEKAAGGSSQAAGTGSDKDAGLDDLGSVRRGLKDNEVVMTADKKKEIDGKLAKLEEMVKKQKYRLRSTIRLYGGHGLPLGSSLSSYKERGTDTNLTKWDGVYPSAGRGVHFGLDFILGFTPHFGLNLGTGLVIGGVVDTLISSDKWEHTADIADETFFVLNSSSYMPVNIGVHVQGSLRINPWAAGGITVAVLGKRVVTERSKTYTYTTYWEKTQDLERTTETAYYPSLGYWGAFGLDFGLTRNIALTLGIKLTHLNLKRKLETVTSWKEDGEDVMDDHEVIDKETFYREWSEGTTNDGDPENDNVRRADYGGPPPRDPFSSILIYLAFTLRF